MATSGSSQGGLFRAAGASTAQLVPFIDPTVDSALLLCVRLCVRITGLLFSVVGNACAA